ncbi:MAG: O-antigen ligase family protein [Clostridia bacterium]|nr:O-antigen ligase family protein [Clostridia bacterium]
MENKKAVEPKKISVEQRFDISSKYMYRLLVMLVWIRVTLWPYVEVVTHGFGFDSLTGFVYMLIFLMLMFFAMPYIITKIRAGDLLFILACFAVILLTIVAIPEHREYIRVENFSNILASVNRNNSIVLCMLVYVVGVSYSHDLCKRDIYRCSLVSVGVNFLYVAYSLLLGRDLTGYSMSAAYNILPCAMYLIYWAYREGKFRNWLPALVGVFLVLAYGTRGPILAIIIFFVLMMFLYKFKNVVLKAMGILGIVVVSFFFTFSGVTANFVLLLQNMFKKIGVSTRIFDFWAEGVLTSDRGREAIANKVWEAILKKPFTGYGYFGDRNVLNGGFAHNLFLEVWCEFGLALGTILLGLLFWVVIRALIRTRGTDAFGFLLLLACMVFTELMFSGSYAVEPNFFLMIGVSLSLIRTSIKERELELKNG